MVFRNSRIAATSSEGGVGLSLEGNEVLGSCVSAKRKRFAHVMGGRRALPGGICTRERGPNVVDVYVVYTAHVCSVSWSEKLTRTVPRSNPSFCLHVLLEDDFSE